MKNWFYKLSRGKQIVVAVLLAHIGCLLFLSADYLLSWTLPKRRKVVVNMVTIAPPNVPATAQRQSTPVAKKPTSKPPALKKPEVKPASKPEKNSASPPAIAKAPPPSPPETVSLLQEIEASLETIASPTPTPTPKTTLHIPMLTEIIRETTGSGSSDEIIAAFLQEVLTLPEFGDVRVSMTIDRSGHLKSLEVLIAKSEKNATFLKNRLPELQYPCLNEEASLTVLFSNAL
ncbi:MAG TPA: hypothetical protein VGO47_00660 [Chlamydiales bacterium]|jgi:hypothetical protein|nr:hypothetical protein [Chlamydiales bacterium]